MDDAFIQTIKTQGPWVVFCVTVFVYVLRLGHRQVWIWGRERDPLIAANKELADQVAFWRDYALELVADARRLAAIAAQREAREEASFQAHLPSAQSKEPKR